MLVNFPGMKHRELGRHRVSCGKGCKMLAKRSPTDRSG